ncbi:ABC transporter permease [Sphaerisporangium perillae]|uniref:ABC transporter permease n=1 Tax=Sphaerisporangium perillae TaxID=2935860 RepID=UPI0020105581|nr:ABC transporter permease [Sphaerisporangium perillae]
MKTITGALRTRAGVIAATVLAVVLLLAVIGPLLAPYDPLKNSTEILQPPSAAHWFGTDYLGRDVLSRVLAGAPRSVFTAFEAVGIGLVIGVAPGITSVYLGRVYEWITLRVMDGLIALPFLIFAIAVAALLGNAVHQAMIAVGILLAPSFYRITRAAALNHANAQYVTASQLFGASMWWVLRTHVWSKILPTLVVATANATAGGLLIVSSLTFLGIGVVPPEPTWGGIVASDLSYLTQVPYGPVFPSLFIMATVGALNLLADAIRDTSGDYGRARILRRGASRVRLT